LCQIFSNLITVTLDNIEKAETGALKLAMLEVLINAVLYNAAPALQVMEQHRSGTASAFINRWFSAVMNEKDKLPRVHDKKLTICAICALMELEPGQVPDGLQRIVSAALRVLKDLPKATAGELFWRIVMEFEVNSFYLDRKALEDALHEISDSEESDQDMTLGGGEEDGRQYFIR
jgi:importin-7